MCTYSICCFYSGLEYPMFVGVVCLPSAVQWLVPAAAALLSAGLRLQPALLLPAVAASSSEAAAGPASGGRTASAQAHLTERRENNILQL